MSISQPQLTELAGAIRVGLKPLERPAPQTPVEWADGGNFYLSSESSYQEGEWETQPFQVAILNAMGNDEIRTINVIKSARVGYSKMLLAASAYQIEHKRRNILVLLPADGSAAGFMKSQIETMVRDVPLVRKLAHWFGIKNHRDSTLDCKRFSHGKQLYCRGGAAAKNYRELSVDTVIYDELAAFEPDVEKEGSPTFLGDKRIEGSTFPKSIRGSTPKLKGKCQIEAAAAESPHFFRLHIPCPCCKTEQPLLWGGKDCNYGIKWDRDKPKTVWYLCAASGCKVQQHEMQENHAAGRWVCDRTGAWTRDGLDFYDKGGEAIPAPDSVTFHVWTAYSPFTTWVQIVADFLLVKGDRNALKTFVNTTLGETFDENEGEKVAWEVLYGRREVWTGQIPSLAVLLTGSVDTQDDRYEGRVWAWGPGEEAWLVYRFILMGDPASEELKRKVGLEFQKQFTRADGLVMNVDRWTVDSGGHYTDEVYAMSKQFGVTWIIPTKGSSVYGKPIANMPRTRNKVTGVYLTMIGTDNAKDLIYSRYLNQVDTAKSQSGIAQPGVVHLPANDDVCDEVETKQLTAEQKVTKLVEGKWVHRWDARGARNEALDCFVGALAALRISQQRFGVNLDLLALESQPGGEAAASSDDRPRRKSSYWNKS
ncbi:phage terminase large subunit family protein [Pseudomonas sp. NMI795_08]|uniref:phage terminase large subunit family protein n=1 Tax=Pseudomonas sp. NMI795_08 TaxID=2903144 RepID=UPI001E47808D|nr:terminase gpA endonuclease subunit [Pseudomonas sp. NMI795_08]MCE1117458.1 phage terminase large subunit family protein [Pseudomonas sp. NMI795_08]